MMQAPEEIVQELYQCTLPDAKCPEHVPGIVVIVIKTSRNTYRYFNS